MKKEERKTPKLRFPEFTGDWEQRKLGDLVSLRGRIGFRGYKQTDLVEPGSGAITFSPADIDDEGHVSLINNKYLSWEKYEESPEIKVQSGDILFTKTASIGKIGYVKELKEKATINPQFALLTPVEEADGYFIFNSVRIDEFMKKVRDITGGSSVPTMSQEKLKELTIMIPSLAEQVRIGDFLTKLDDTITLHQRKLEQTQEYKKGMLQKMFPKKGEKVPEVRFPGFTDDWEQRKVQEIYKITRGYVLAAPETDETVSDEMPYPVYSSQTKNNGLMGYYKDYLYENAITWTTDGANAGTVNYRAGKFYCTNVCGVLLSEEGYSNKCAAEALNSVAWKWVSHVGNPKLMNNVMGEILITLPKSLEEQNRLSIFFEQIDNLITLHQRELEEMKEYKKGLLQQMFI